MKLSLCLAAGLIPMGESRWGSFSSFRMPKLPSFRPSTVSKPSYRPSTGSRSFIKSKTAPSLTSSKTSMLPSKGLRPSFTSKPSFTNKPSFNNNPPSSGNKVGNLLGGLTAGAAILGVGAGLYQLNEQKAMQETMLRQQAQEHKDNVDIAKKQLSAAGDTADEMAYIEETTTDENTKLCASCSGQLAQFYEQFQTLANAICKEEYEQTMAQARGLVGLAKKSVETLANSIYDPVENFCIQGGIPLEDIFEQTKPTLVSQFGGCDWKCGTDQEFHQMMKQGICHPYDYDNVEYRNLHQRITCN